MQINVGQLLKEHTGASRSYDIADISSHEKNSQHIQGTIDLLRTKRGILVKAKVKTQIEENCIRCLKTMLCSIYFEFEEEVFPQVYLEDQTTDADYENRIIDNNNILNLSDLLRQYIELNKPSKLLCKPDCRGIQII